MLFDTSPLKYNFQSEMMRRDINGKLDGDGVKAGDTITTTASILAPMVVGKVLIPAESPQSLKSLGGLPEAAQALKVPQGMTEAQFTKFSQLIKESKAAEYGTDIRVHGSRAAGTAKEASDIDVAIRVPKEKFDQLVKEAFKNVKQGSGSAAEKTMLWSMKTGKIQRGEIKLRNLGNLLKQDFGYKVDISVIKEGGTFDQGHWIPLK